MNDLLDTLDSFCFHHAYQANHSYHASLVAHSKDLEGDVLTSPISFSLKSSKA
jgi:hypothetical protein